MPYIKYLVPVGNVAVLAFSSTTPRGPTQRIGQTPDQAYFNQPVPEKAAAQTRRKSTEKTPGTRSDKPSHLSFNDDPVLAHQSPDTPVPHVDTKLLQLFGHPGPPVAAKAQA